MLPESSQQPGVAGIIYTSYQFGEWPSERCMVGPAKVLFVSFHMPSTISCSDNSSLMFGPFKEDGKKLVESRSCSNCLLSVNFSQMKITWRMTKHLCPKWPIPPNDLWHTSHRRGQVYYVCLSKDLVSPGFFLAESEMIYGGRFSGKP